LLLILIFYILNVVLYFPPEKLIYSTDWWENIFSVGWYRKFLSYSGPIRFNLYSLEIKIPKISYPKSSAIT